MTVTIAGIELNRLQNLKVDEKRSIVEHRLPGSDGSLFQNMGREAVSITFEGVLQHGEGVETLQKLREKFNGGEVLSFSSGAATPPGIEEVVIEALRVVEVAGRPGFYRYFIGLREVMKAPASFPDAGSMAEIDGNVMDEAGEFLETIENGLDALQGAAEVKAVVDRLSPSIKRLGELVGKLNVK